MRVRLPLALFLLPACEFLEEQRVLPDQVDWAGYVYADLPAEDTALLEAGTLEVVDLDDALVATGTQREDTPGYWQVQVPVDQEVAIRIDGGDQVPTVWRGRTPTGAAYWLTGALFALDAETVSETFGALDGWQDLSPDDLADAEVAHLWVQPWDPEAWAGATIEVLDYTGLAPYAALAVDADGALIDAGAGPVDLLLVPDLMPGHVTLRVTTAAGKVAETAWPARGGDLLSGFYFTLPAD